MIRFEKLEVPEKIYPYVDAIASADYANGTFGTITSGKFTAGEGFYAIMQVEKGAFADSDLYKIAKDEHARIADFSKADGQWVNITAEQLPATVAVGNKLAPASTGKLVVDADATGSYFEVKEVADYGVRAVVVVGTEE